MLSRPLINRLIRPFVLSVVAGIGLYAIAVLASDLQAVWGTVLELGAVGWFVILALSLANYALRFVRWHVYLRQLGYAVPLGCSVAYYLGGFAFTTTPGKAGEAVRSLYLKRHGVAYAHSLAALFIERLVDLGAMVLLAAVATIAFENTRWLIVVTAGITIAALSLVRSRTLLRLLGRLSLKLPSQRLVALAQSFLDLLRSSAILLRAHLLFGGLALGLLSWGAEGLGLYVILVYLDVDTSLALALGIYAVSILAGAASLIPGGLGSTEAVMGLLLILIGADAVSAVAATLVCRIATLWFAVLIGFVCIAWLEWGAGQRMSTPPSSSEPR